MSEADKDQRFRMAQFQIVLATKLRAVNLKDGIGTDLQFLSPALSWTNLLTIKEWRNPEWR